MKSSIPHRMMMAFITMAGLALTSCEKEELPVKPRERGEVKETNIALGSDYKHQVWYDLSEDNVISTNFKTDWHIAFDCSDTTDLIWLNTSLAAQAAIAKTTDFNALKSDDDLTYRPDHHTGNPDSLGIGRLNDLDKIYVIDLGYDEAGNPIGKVKFQVTETASGIYSFRYAYLNESEIHTAQVKKDQLFNRIAYSFETHQSINIEPPKDQYDLCFTQYTYVFYEPYTPYLVTGVLINSYEVEAALDTLHEFTSINRDILTELTFSKDADIIGYAWKYFSLDGGSYSVDPSMNYVIKDHEGYYYKLHFIDFYDDEGKKGNPKFEFQQL